jgi:hypothetical protein
MYGAWKGDEKNNESKRRKVKKETKKVSMPTPPSVITR